MSERRHGESEQERALPLEDSSSRFRVGVLMLLAVAVLLFTAVEGMRVYPMLPERIPTHFGPTGEPDAWSDKSFWSVFGLLLVGVALVGMIGFTASRLCSPKLYNFPGKERMLVMSREWQDYALQPIREGLAWMGASLGIGFAMMTRQGWAVALEERATLSPWVMMGPIVVGLMAVTLGIIYTRARLNELRERADRI